MTLPKRPTDTDPHREYEPEYAATLDALDRMNEVFEAIRTFRKRSLPHTDLDAMMFKRRHEKAERHRDEARALLAAHATFVEHAEESAHLKALETFREQAPEDADSPLDSDDVDAEVPESPVDLDEVNEHTRRMHEAIERMFEAAEAYAAEQEDGTIYTPWVDAGDQLDKLRSAEELADEAYEQTWELAPNPWPN